MGRKDVITLGVDIGSTASKAILLKNGAQIIAKAVAPAGTGTSGPARVLNEVFEKSQLKENAVAKTIATGYGRMAFKGADKQISELSCHAKGVYYLLPAVRTIIDIGGQDAKALKLNENGRMINFVMNDKCAAGTGRFLDVMANVLEVKVQDLGYLSQQAAGMVDISSTCTVFAESEVISHLSTGIDIKDIIVGIHKSIASRVGSLAKRVGIENEIVMTGGVAQNSGVVRALEIELNSQITTHKLAQYTGALGAALFAWDEVRENEQGRWVI